jgi:hypothetical protein
MDMDPTLKYSRKFEMYSLKRTFSKIVTITLLFVVAATASEAFAQNPFDDQEPAYHIETFLGDEHIPDPLMARGTLGEARNAFGNLFQTWRGAANNQVWMAVDGGTAFTLGNTNTLQAPTVVPYGFSNFVVFHVGADNDQIYYTIVNSLGGWISGEWIPVPGQTTSLPVSVTQFGAAGSTNLYMVYLSSSGDGRIYGTWFDNNGWHLAGNINGAQARSQPSVTYGRVTQQLWMVAEGLDGNIISSSNPLGSSDWTEFEDEGVASNGPAVIASAPVDDPPDEGQMVISYRNANRTALFEITDEHLEGRFSTVDTTFWQTNDSVGLTVTNDQVFDRFTGLNNRVYYKFLGSIK